MIYLKSDSDIAYMRESGAIVRDTLLLMERTVREGVTTAHLNEVAEKYIRSCKAEPSFLNYNGYPASICASVNEEVVHGIPGDRVLHHGDVVSIDVGAVKNGFHGDAARTFIVGSVPENVRKLVEVTRQSFFEGVAMFKEGNRLGDISHAVQSYAESFGFSVVRAMVGHGIGKSMHEDPAVPNYGRAAHGMRLEKGLALAIEPMIAIGTYDVYVEENEWTVVTADRKTSAHYENTVVLTDNGPEILTL